MINDEYLKVANQSGFPLQIAVANLVRRCTELGWNVYCVEQAWERPNSSGASGFIDLVIEKWNSFFVIECKRVRESTWIFLLPDKGQLKRRFAKSWITAEASPGAYNYLGWHSVSLLPISPESAFCAVRGQEAHSRTLERIGSELVRATEVFAMQHSRVRSSRDSQPIRRYYFNMIVTTAKLAICDFSPNDINLKDGMIEKADIELVPFVRFRKQFSTAPLGSQPEATYFPYGEENENTIFVVNSEHVESFLEEFEISTESLKKYR